MRNLQNTAKVVENGLCISCGLCAIACPRKAIRMMFNNYAGMVFPVVDGRTCNGCKLCLKVCYGFEVDRKLNLRLFKDLPTSIVGNYLNSYLGFAVDEELRFNSSSGGLVTSLLLHALDQNLIDGAIVTRMKGSNPPHARAILATNDMEILSAMGSKYCPVSLAQGMEKMEEGSRYGVVGLPCHIYGIRKLAEIKPRIRDQIRLHIGIICGGMPSYLGTQYILRTHNVEERHVSRLEYRGAGWPGRLLIQTESQNQASKISAPYPDYWRGVSQYFLPYRCTVCHDGFNEFSDITCGDAWLPHLMERDRKGTSLVITRSGIGECLLNDASKMRRIKTTAIGSSDIVRSQRGLVEFKSLTLKARMEICRIARKVLPSFDTSRIPQARPRSLASAIELYVGREMASNKRFWPLFDFYVWAKRKLGLF